MQHLPHLCHQMLERDCRVIDRLEQALLSPGRIISTVDQPALTPDNQNLLSKLNPLYSHVMHTTRLSIKVFFGVTIHSNCTGSCFVVQCFLDAEVMYQSTLYLLSTKMVLRSRSAKLGITFKAVHMACYTSHSELSAHSIISIEVNRALRDSRRQIKCFMCCSLVISEKLRASCPKDRRIGKVFLGKATLQQD